MRTSTIQYFFMFPSQNKFSFLRKTKKVLMSYGCPCYWLAWKLDLEI